MPRAPKGSFNAILYTDRGKRRIVRRTTLGHAIRAAETHARQEVGFYASVVRATDGQNIGLALRSPSGNHQGEFRFSQS